VAQETLSFTEMRLSLKSFSPSATFSGVGSDPRRDGELVEDLRDAARRFLGVGAAAAMLSAATAAAPMTVARPDSRHRTPLVEEDATGERLAQGRGFLQ